jgi:hypothetical protein
MADLAAVFTKPDKSCTIHLIREFTPEQFAELETNLDEFINLRQKFSLLHISEFNFSAIDAFVKRFQTSDHIDAGKTLSEANCPDGVAPRAGAVGVHGTHAKSVFHAGGLRCCPPKSCQA